MDGVALQTQDSKLDPWRSEAEHATSRSQALYIIESSRVSGKKLWMPECQSGWRARDLRLSKQAALTTVTGHDNDQLWLLKV